MIRKPSALMWFAVLLLLGAVLALTMPPNPATLHALHITPGVYHAAVLTLVLPYGIIWFTAFYAYEKLNQYANKVRAAREGEAFQRIADGVCVLAWGLAVPTIVSILMGGIVARYPGFAAPRTIIGSYITLLVSLIGFTIISRGTRQFNEIVRVRPSRMAVQTLMVIFIAVGAFYVSIVTHAQDTGHAPYHMPAYLVITTLIIPHMFAWFVGLLSAYELWLYAHKTAGVLYRHALSYFAGGFALVVIAAIAAQYVMGVYLNRAVISLGPVLVVTYGLLTLQAVGYSLIALAAKRLKRLEEV